MEKNVIIQTESLSKDFGGRRAVDALNLQVAEGDVYGFLGPNGAGKSTTIRMLTGLVRPTSGSSRLLGFDVRSERTRALRYVGALVESPAFYNYLSARENLRILSSLSGPTDPERIEEVLRIVGLSERAGDKVKTFSHGMRQRLGIGQALLPDPRLVILDEPTNGLDPQGMRDVRELIQRLARDEKMTVFLSSHLLHEVEQVCNRVGIINSGRLVLQGGVRELREGGRLELTVGSPARALELLENLECAKAEAPAGILEAGPARLIVHCPSDRVPEIVRVLASGGVDIYSAVPSAVTLEDLFFEKVGASRAD